jgi:predicted lipoprotein with Yx(FWY)xxD motif
MRSPLRLLPLAILAGLLALSGCSADTSPQPPEPQPAAAAEPDTGAGPTQGHGGHGGHGGTNAGPPALWAVQSGPLGVVATDGTGALMYRSDADTANPSTSTCTDPCTQTWLPATIENGQEPDLLGVDAARVGRLVRPDGTTQLTLAGWPLYRHRDDPGGLQTSGAHGTDDTWFAVTPTGEKAVAP